MSRTGVFIATLALAGGCGKDPILAAVEREEAERAAKSGVAPGAAAAEDAPTGAGAPAEAELPELPAGAARKIPSRYFPDGTAGTGATAAAAAGATPVPGTPTPVPGTPTPVPGSATPVPGTPTPGTPTPPAPGIPGGPTPAAATPTSAGVPAAPTPGKPADPPPGRPTEPAPGNPGSPGAISGPTVKVRGRVEFPAWSKGQVRVTAFDADHQAHPVKPPQVVGAVLLARPGEYEMLVPLGKGKIYVEATVDVDGDGRPGRLEPMGLPSRYPVTITDKPVTGLDIEVKPVAPPPDGGE